MDHPNPTKEGLRKQLSAALEALAPEEWASQGGALAGWIGPWAQTRGLEVILATLPLAGEPDLTPLLAQWIKGGRRVALARTGPGRSLSFHYVESLTGPWESRPYGLREPLLTNPAWEPGPRTLVLVPGLGFAPASGKGALRLGRGAGYYDRWLAAHGKEVFALGVGLTIQSLATLPIEDHDQILDGWVDPTGFHGF